MKKIYSVLFISTLILGLSAFGAFAVEGGVDYSFFGTGGFYQQWVSESDVFTSMSANAFGLSSAVGRFYGEDWGDGLPYNQYTSAGLDVVMSRIDADLTGPGSLEYNFERLDGGSHYGTNASSRTKVELFANPLVVVAPMPTAELNTESHTTGNPYIGAGLDELISDYNHDGGESGWFPKLGGTAPGQGLITTAGGYDVEVSTVASYNPNPECDPCGANVNHTGWRLIKEIYNTQGERLFVRAHGGGWAGMLTEDSDMGDDELLLGKEDVGSFRGSGADFDANGWGRVEIGGTTGDLEFNSLGVVPNIGAENFIGIDWVAPINIDDFTVHKDR